MTIMSAMGRNILDGALLGPTFPLRHLSQLLHREFHTSTIRHAGKVTFRPRSSDAETFVDIFRRGAYDFSWLRQYDRVLSRYRALIDAGKTPAVIDASANIGAASI